LLVFIRPIHKTGVVYNRLEASINKESDGYLITITRDGNNRQKQALTNVSQTPWTIYDRNGTRVTNGTLFDYSPPVFTTDIDRDGVLDQGDNIYIQNPNNMYAKCKFILRYPGSSDEILRITLK